MDNDARLEAMKRALEKERDASKYDIEKPEKQPTYE